MGCICGFLQPCCKRLGCTCQGNDSDEPLLSIEKKRVCTDILCIILFGIFTAVLVFYVWTVAWIEGDPDRLVRGVNHNGLICGKSEAVKDLPYAFWPDVTEYRFKVCTDDCNQATNEDFAQNHIKIPVPGSTIDQTGLAGYKSHPYMSRYCRPDTDALADFGAALVDGMDSRTEMAERAIGDVKTAMPLFGITFPVAMLMSFVFIFMMRICVGCFVWSIILLILVCGYGMGYVLYDWSKDEGLTSTEENARLYIGIGFWVATTVFLLMIIFARKRIKIAIEVIKSASRTFADMPFMVLFPVPVIFIFAGFFFAWAYGAVYIFSAGETKMNESPESYVDKTFKAEGDAFLVADTFEVIDYNDTIKNSFAPHFFLLLWVTQIFVYFTFTVIAGAVSDWYFTARDDDGDKKRGLGEGELSRCAVTKSCCRTFRYHLGSVIFAAFIIATIQFIRACVHYIERQLNPGDKEPNMIQKVLFRCLDCMLWCLECCLDKVNRNALVWVSVYGDAFCPAVCGSFKMIWSNLFRIAVITFFSGIVTLLGKILIPILSTVIMALVLHYMDDFDDITSPFLPLVIIFIISFGVAQLFMTVYDTAIDTVFLCFLIDEKHNKSSGQMLADPELRDIVQKYEADSKKLADSKTRGRRTKRDENGGGDKAEKGNNNDSIELQV